MDEKVFLQGLVDIIKREVVSLDTAWDHIHLILCAFDGNVTGRAVDVHPIEASRKRWISRDGAHAMSDLMLAWQRSASGAGRKAFAVVAKIDRRDLETRFFHGDEAEEWNVATVRRNELTRKAEQLFE